MNGYRCLRIGQKEQTYNADPKDPPGYPVTAPLIREPPAQGADNTGRQYKDQGYESRLLQVQTVLRHVIFGQPQRKRYKSSKDKIVGETIPPHPGFRECLELFTQSRKTLVPPAVLVLGIVIGKKPKNDGHDHHGNGVDHGYRTPAQGHDDQWRDENIQRCTGVAGTEYTHRKTLLFFSKPGRGVSNTDGERSTGQAYTETDDKVLPELIGKMQAVCCNGNQDHLGKINNTPAEAVGEKTKRQTYQRTRKDGCGNE